MIARPDRNCPALDVAAPAAKPPTIADARRPREWLAALRALGQELRNDLFEHEGLAILFQHARNLLTSAMVIAAGLYAMHHLRSSQLPGMGTVRFAGYVVAALGVLLLLLNLAEGLRRLAQRRHAAPLRWVAILVYIALSLRLTQVIVYFRAPW